MSATHTAKSPLPGIADDAWMTLVAALEVQSPRSVSESGGFGAYDMRPRRLQELGLVRVTDRKNRRHKPDMDECDFVAPLTRDRFLSDPLLQYRTLCQSLRRYYDEMKSGVIARPNGVSLAGALAILHRGRRVALQKWPNLFTDTRARYEAAQGAF